MASADTPTLRRNVACPFCGLVCDDLTVAVDGAGMVEVREAGCALSRAGFARAATDPTPRIGGRAASLAEAANAAATILADCRQPVFGGLGTDTDGMRAVMRLAERLGGVVDHRGADGLFRNLRIVQDSGWMTTTLSEIRNRMDVLLILGRDPRPIFPRFFERCLPRGRTRFAEAAPMPAIYRLGPVVEPRRHGPDDVAIDELICDEERLLEAASALRCLIKDRPVAAESIGGLPVARLRALAEALAAARYSVVSWVAGSLDFDGAELLILSMSELVRDLNKTTRSAALPLTGNDNLIGINQLCTWQSGAPLRSSFRRGVPEHDQHLFSTRRMLDSGEADALVWISAFRPEPPPATASPTIALGLADTPFAREPEVFIPVGTPGKDHGGQVFRTDGVVALQLVGLRPSAQPSVALAVAQIDQALSGPRS